MRKEKNPGEGIVQLVFGSLFVCSVFALAYVTIVVFGA